MLKAVGMCAITVGALLGLESWRSRCRQRQKRLEELSFFFRRAEYAMKVEQRPLIPFFRGERVSSPLGACLRELADRMERAEDPDGYWAWCQVLQAHRGEWDLSEEQWEILLCAGRAFFGRNREELSRLLEYYRERMLQEYEQEKRRQKERQRVVYPLGVLGSVMLIVLLV